MTDDAELIESLRLWNRDDAADRIEALIAENTKLHHHIEGAAKDTHKIMVGYEAKLARAVEALTPSGDTKAAYMGEIKDPETKRLVSWTAIKMTMKMITDRAAIAEIKGESHE